MNQIYTPPTRDLWFGRQETLPHCYVHEAISLLDLREPSPHRVDGVMAILGFAVEEGIVRNGGRLGAKEGPKAFRNAIRNMALPKRNFYTHLRCWRFDMFEWRS